MPVVVLPFSRFLVQNGIGYWWAQNGVVHWWAGLWSLDFPRSCSTHPQTALYSHCVPPSGPHFHHPTLLHRWIAVLFIVTDLLCCVYSSPYA